jgi:hypothetical protein
VMDWRADDSEMEWQWVTSLKFATSMSRTSFLKFIEVGWKLFNNRIVQFISNLCLPEQKLLMKVSEFPLKQDRSAETSSTRRPKSVESWVTLFCKIAMKWECWFWVFFKHCNLFACIRIFEVH